MVVGAGDHVLAVVVDRVDAEHRHPRHRRRQPPVAIVSSENRAEAVMVRGVADGVKGGDGEREVAVGGG
jgi:hypothetical protein